MIIQVLAAEVLAMSICIVSPAKDTCIRDVVGKKVTEPLHPICSRPRLVSMSV